MTEIFTENWGQWLIVLLSLIALAYTAQVIKNEKNTFLKNARPFNFKHFKLFIPTWWAKKDSEQNDQASFYRADTRYEWEASFYWRESSEFNARELLEKRLKEKDIRIDELTKEWLGKDQLKISSELKKDENYDIARIEGTASTSDYDRIYYDGFVITDKNKKGFLLCESTSSVLNGLVEGPYFEEVVMRLSPS